MPSGSDCREFMDNGGMGRHILFIFIYVLMDVFFAADKTCYRKRVRYDKLGVGNKGQGT